MLIKDVVRILLISFTALSYNSCVKEDAERAEDSKECCNCEKPCMDPHPIFSVRIESNENSDIDTRSPDGSHERRVELFSWSVIVILVMFGDDRRDDLLHRD